MDIEPHIWRMDSVESFPRGLTDPAASRIVSIDGMGGIGKSALAIEAAHLLQENAFFEKVIWISTASSEIDNALTLEGIINAITTKLGLPEINRLPLAEKLSRLRTIFLHRRVLVVLDNLDTAAAPQEQIVDQFRTLLGYSRALLTSRRRFSGDLFSIHLTGFDFTQ